MNDFCLKKLKIWLLKRKSIPMFFMFNPYNCYEITDYAPTLSTQCGSTTTSSSVLIFRSEKYVSERNK